MEVAANGVFGLRDISEVIETEVMTGYGGEQPPLTRAIHVEVFVGVEGTWFDQRPGGFPQGIDVHIGKAQARYVAAASIGNDLELVALKPNR